MTSESFKREAELISTIKSMKSEIEYALRNDGKPDYVKRHYLESAVRHAERVLISHGEEESV